MLPAPTGHIIHKPTISIVLSHPTTIAPVPTDHPNPRRKSSAPGGVMQKIELVRKSLASILPMFAQADEA